jgi:hypothetical protein
VPDPDLAVGLALAQDHPVREALEQLGAKHPERIPPRMFSRLLVALAVLGRIYEEDLARTSEGEDAPLLAQALLPFREPGSDRPDIELHELLLHDGVFEHIGHWQSFASTAESNGALRSGIADHPAPCTDSVVPELLDGQDVGAVRLATLICDANVTDAEVMTFLNVQSWKICNPLYCGLVDRGAVPYDQSKLPRVVSCHEWTEELSPNCAQKQLAGEIKVCLVFTLEKLADNGTWWRLSYDRCPKPEHDYGKVLIDKGEIIVRKQGGRWCFDTTKFVRFAGVADGTHLGLIACVMGYGTMAQDFLTSCVPKGTAVGGTPPDGGAMPDESADPGYT